MIDTLTGPSLTGWVKAPRSEASGGPQKWWNFWPNFFLVEQIQPIGEWSFIRWWMEFHPLVNGVSSEGEWSFIWRWMEFHLKLVSWWNLINAGEATQEMAAGLLPVEAPKARAQQEVVNCVNSWICPSFSKTSINKKMNCNTRNLYSTFSLSKSLVQHLRSWSQ